MNAIPPPPPPNHAKRLGCQTKASRFLSSMWWHLTTNWHLKTPDQQRRDAAALSAAEAVMNK